MDRLQKHSIAAPFKSYKHENDREKEKGETYRQARGLSVAPPPVFFRQNPFFCGTVLNQVYKDYTTIGIDLMLTRGTLHGVLHLYNALIQYKVMETIPLFEKMMDMFDLDSFQLVRILDPK